MLFDMHTLRLHDPEAIGVLVVWDFEKEEAFGTSTDGFEFLGIAFYLGTGGDMESGAVLYGVTEVWIYGDVPGLEQPFWDVNPIPIAVAPAV